MHPFQFYHQRRINPNIHQSYRPFVLKNHYSLYYFEAKTNSSVLSENRRNKNMKYMCRTCKKKCDDILEHLMKVHKFSKAIVESQLKANPNSYKNSFEII